MLAFCTLILQVNFFVFPISAGFLTYKKIHGKPADRYFRMMVMSFIMILLSYTGVVLNETQEHRAEIVNNWKNFFTIGTSAEQVGK